MDNLEYHIDSTNIHLFLIPGDDASLNESCISVSEVIFCLKMMYKALHRHKLHQQHKVFLHRDLANANGVVVMMKYGWDSLICITLCLLTGRNKFQCVHVIC